MDVDQNAEALRALRVDGPLPSREIAARVGWAPRSAGAKMSSLEAQKYVVRKTVVGADDKPVLVWALTERGATIARPKISEAPSPPVLASPAADGSAVDEDREHKDGPSEAVGTPEEAEVAPAAAANDEGPWPSLRNREGGVDPDTAISASDTGWLFVLRAAHSGASDRSAGDRKVIETHLKKLEDQLGWRWVNGLYENSAGEAISVHKLNYLKRNSPPQEPTG